MCEIVYNDNNISCIEFIEYVSDFRDNPIDVSSDIANLDDYQGMYVIVPNATITAEGNGIWGSSVSGSTMTFTPLETANKDAFYVFIKGSTGLNDVTYVTGSEGNIVGTVMHHSKGYGVGIQFKTDITSVFDTVE